MNFGDCCNGHTLLIVCSDSCSDVLVRLVIFCREFIFQFVNPKGVFAAITSISLFVELGSNYLFHSLRPQTNLTKLQQSHLLYLRSNKDFIILMCDKNLGPAIMERASYIKHVLAEHLSDNTTYKPITDNEAGIALKTQKRYRY